MAVADTFINAIRKRANGQTEHLRTELPNWIPKRLQLPLWKLEEFGHKKMYDEMHVSDGGRTTADEPWRLLTKVAREAADHYSTKRTVDIEHDK